MIAVGSVVLVGCFAQSIAGTGLGLISGGVMVAILGREPAIMLLTLISLPLMLAVAWQNRQEIRWSLATIMGGTSLALTPALAVWMRGLDQAALLIACGVLILVSVLLLYIGLTAPKLATKRGAVATGSVVAVMNMLSGMGGPPAAIYAVNAGWSAKATRGTLQITFLLLAVGTIGSLRIPHWDPAVVITAVGAAVVGTGVGIYFAPKIRADLARIAILVLAAIGGIFALGSGLSQVL